MAKVVIQTDTVQFDPREAATTPMLTGAREASVFAYQNASLQPTVYYQPEVYNMFQRLYNEATGVLEGVAATTVDAADMLHSASKKMDPKKGEAALQDPQRNIVVCVSAVDGDLPLDPLMAFQRVRAPYSWLVDCLHDVGDN